MPVNLVSRREDRVAPKLSSDEDEEKAIVFNSRAHRQELGNSGPNVPVPKTRKVPVPGCSV